MPKDNPAIVRNDVRAVYFTFSSEDCDLLKGKRRSRGNIPANGRKRFFRAAGINLRLPQLSSKGAGTTHA